MLYPNLFGNITCICCSAAHVGQSTVTVIQKGKNGSFWIVDKNEPPYSIEVPSHTLD